MNKSLQNNRTVVLLDKTVYVLIHSHHQSLVWSITQIHNCPVISRINSTGYKGGLIRFGSEVL